MLVKEEKVLLLAKTENLQSSFLAAIKQVCSSCIVTPGIELGKLTLFDIEFIFLTLRKISINNVVKVSYQDNEDGGEHEFEIKLDDVKVKFPENEKFKIEVNKEISIIMKYPQASLYDDKKFWLLEGKEAIDYLIVHSLDIVEEGAKKIPVSGLSSDEIRDFVDNLPISVYDELNLFFSNLPSLYHELSYVNSAGKERKIVMTTLSDFFTF